MYSEISRQKHKSPVTVKSAKPTHKMPLAEARERLNEEFGDVVSVHKAFQMLGNRLEITPQVRQLTSKLCCAK